jgi:pyruvate/2-oxoglutarate dehydrogenase complex dihydrolipoamide acyltransferase (E2) component
LRAENKLVSAQLADKDVTFTALALSRFSRAQVVPEDDTKGVINLRLQQVPFEKAVGKVARQVHRKWSRVYTLQPLNLAVLGRQPGPEAPGTNAAPVADTNQAAAAPDAGTLAQEQALEALVSTMTPEERQQTLEQIDAAKASGAAAPVGGQPQMQPASAAAAQAAQAAQQDLQRRIELRLKDGTVDQRIAHDRRVLNNKQGGAKQ